MDTKFISEVTKWMKTTDLAEFCYEKDGDAIEIKTKEALPEPTEFSCSFTAVTSPAVGIYRMAEKGKSLVLAEGQDVKAGDVLGLIETVGKKHVIKAPLDGKLRMAAAKDGAPAEYGLPLFFIEK